MEDFAEQWIDIGLCMAGFLHPTMHYSSWLEGYWRYWTDRDFGDEG